MIYNVLSKNRVELLSKNLNVLSKEGYNQYIVSRGYYDIGYFSDVCLRDWKMHNKTGEFIKTPSFHYEIWKHLNSGKNLNIIIARWHGKTTAILIWILHSLLYEKEKDILYIASKGLWVKGTQRIKQELESNSVIIQLFWLQKPSRVYKKDGDSGKRWSLWVLQLSNGTSLETKSSGEKIRWDRPTKIIFDDPQENKDVENKEIVDRFNRWVFTSLYNTLLPWGSMCALGTIIWNLCLVKYLRDDKKWFTVEYEACDKDFGNVLWKDMWSADSLRARRDGVQYEDGRFEQGIGSSYFNQEFRNIPLNKENALIKENWIRYWTIKPDVFDYIIMGVDPATDEKEVKKWDYAGISIVWVSGNNNYVLYCEWERLSSRDLQNKIKRLYGEYNVSVIVYEKNKEETLWLILKEEALPVIMEHTTRDKTSRLLSQQSKFENGNVYIPYWWQCEELVYQLLNFPDIAHDDEMDSLILALQTEYQWWWWIVVF